MTWQVVADHAVTSAFLASVLWALAWGMTRDVVHKHKPQKREKNGRFK